MFAKLMTIAIIGGLLTSSLFADTIIPAGSVYGTWDILGSPYLVEGEIYIPSDSTLIIEPGVDVIFQGHYKFIVNGRLEAIGTESDSILFTAADTSIGWHSIRFTNAPDSSHMNYCIIRYGRASGYYPNPDAYGGGIYCENSNPVVIHCYIGNNFAYAGAGVYCDNSNPNIYHCTIYGNSTNGSSGGIYCNRSSPTITNSEISRNLHVGICCFDGSNPTIDNCTLNENLSHGIQCYNSSPTINNCTICDNWELVAAGIWCGYESNPIITNCTISRNHGGSGSANGGVVCQDNSSPLISHCTISDNSGMPGAGGINCLSESSPIIEFCLITGNHGSAGGISCAHNSSPHIDHCTISNNTGFIGQGAGAISIWYADSPVVTNTILEGNTGDGAIRIFYSQNPSITYCDFYNNQNANFIGEIPPGLGELVTQNLNGDSCDTFFNIFLDPLFVDTTSGNYQLLNGSPCVDAGNPTSPLDPDSTITDIGAFYLHQEGVQPGHPKDEIPLSFGLNQNYPNPFNPTTNITFDLPMSSQVTILIYDITGRHVTTLTNNRYPAGTHNVLFNGSGLSSGVYFCQCKANAYNAIKKMVLIK